MKTTWIVGLCVFVTSGAAAQTTAEGVQAFASGNFGRAAEILKPIAERQAAPDTVAQYFMAVLYQNGTGVLADATRACVLFMRAAGDHGSFFGRQAQRLTAILARTMNRDSFQECSTLAHIGLDNRFEPVTVWLEPGYWISFDLRGVTIARDGREKRSERSLVVPGAVHLPVVHTELASGSPAASRRHFIEILAWTPVADGPTWRLLWQLFEVAGDDLVGVAGEQIASASGIEPPTSFDVRRTVRLFVNENGQVEWALSGPTPRRGIIETAAEREEARRRERARSDALARIDWSRVVDLHRTPRVKYSDSDGCGEVFVYGWSDDRTEVITVSAAKDRLQLQTVAQTFDIARQPPGLEIQLHVYQRAVRQWSFCSDLIVEPRPAEAVWRAIAGTVTIELSPRGIDARMPFGYRATIRIVGAEFVDGAGTRVKQSEPITLTALVGWFAG